MLVLAPAIWTPVWPSSAAAHRVACPSATNSTWSPTTRWCLLRCCCSPASSSPARLAAFLVLDEIDAGTLTALRVTPVPLSMFFAYRAGTVVVVTTVYVVATLSFSGMVEPAWCRP